MAKKCMKCGGAMKMAKGGAVAKPFAAGIPYATGAGATDGKNGMMKKGGAVKKMADGGPVIKSKKVRNVSLNSFGDSDASVTKTRRNGTTVTRSVNTNQGYAPTASKSKSITNKEGKTTTSSKSMDYDKAGKKQISIAKRVGRNPNDEGTINGYKKGGVVKNAKLAALAAPKNKITRADVIVGAKRNARKK